jgi:hypothetical protein
VESNAGLSHARQLHSAAQVAQSQCWMNLQRPLLLMMLQSKPPRSLDFFCAAVDLARVRVIGLWNVEMRQMAVVRSGLQWSLSWKWTSSVDSPAASVLNGRTGSRTVERTAAAAPASAVGQI